MTASQSTFCDRCSLSEYIPGTAELACKRKHPIRFQMPRVDTKRADYSQQWGFRPVAGYCRDYTTVFDSAQPQRRKKRFNRRKQHGGDSTFHPAAIVDSRPELEASQLGAASLQPRTDLPGLDALNQKYAAELEAGRNLKKRIFGE